MHISPKLSHFTVQLALLGILREELPRAIKDLRDEIDARPHLKNPRVSLDAISYQAVVSVDTEGLDPESAGKQMAEELFEIACAVLSEVEGMHVEIRGVQPQ